MRLEHKEKLYYLWQEGLGLQQAILSMKRLGVEMSREEVRRFYVRFSHGYTPYA